MRPWLPVSATFYKTSLALFLIIYRLLTQDLFCGSFLNLFSANTIGQNGL